MNILTDAVRLDGEYTHLSDAVRRALTPTSADTPAKPMPLLVNGLCEGAQDAFAVSLINDYKSFGRIAGENSGFRTALIFCSEEKECLRLVQIFEVFGLRAAFWPVRDLTLYNITASHEYEYERLRVLFGLVNGNYDVVLTTPDAALGYTIPGKKLAKHRNELDISVPVDPDKLACELVDAGYVRMEMVDGAGQFAIRGGIIDIYPPCGLYTDPDGKTKCGAYPIRLELFGDEIDRMGIFGLESQRFETNITNIVFSPARELIIGKNEQKKLCDVITAHLRNAKNAEAAAEIALELGAVKAAYESGTPINFADKYISLIYPEHVCLLDYFKDNSPLVMVFATNSVNDRLKTAEWHLNQSITDLLELGTLAPKYAEYSKPAAEFEHFCDNNMTIHVDSMTYGMSGKRLGGMFGFRTRQLVSHSENFDLLCEDLTAYIKQNYRVTVIAENETAAENLRAMLQNAGFSAIKEADLGDFTAETLPRGTVLIKYREAIPPYELLVPKIAIMTTVPDSRRMAAASAVRMKQKAKRKKGTEAIMSYTDLEVGDYVVHEKYGIGQYTGIENLTINGVSRDYFGVRYAGSDKLFLPVDKLDMVSKYIGAHADDGLIKLDKMGGESWNRSKTKAKAAVREMAGELIRLYAERSRLPGFAFDADNDFQHDFEAAFEYEETQGQLDAIEDIKEDMMKHTPMDRLLCGDVGFGKTEVALRAAYKAVLSGKQVAILVPTTILALQHYQTLQSRFRGFAVNCDMISRFRTNKEIEKSIRKLRRNETDIVVGTHRLLSKDVAFNDLGLLIIDEEQRFGVAQKERLKQLSKNVDVLTLTATPIPRTLNMALGGIRDISVLDEAPGDRLPIQTYVLEHDDMIIHEAIRRELRRGGQVFYLHNIVEDIPEVAGRIAKEHPDARVVYAHGKMSKEELEDIWAEMLSGAIDILVCTTIIETGVDVPNANTLIVDNAHRLGLSQLHQIRGRVGRSSRRAYAYFTYPKGRSINEIAVKRLEAIREYTEFGSGFRIAMRDLEIRGAGDLLGAKQHGNLDAVGYDLYIKLLNEAILEEKGEKPKPRTECSVTLEYSAFIPENYIKFSSQRMGMYKRIAMIRTQEDCDDIADELLDRYGEMPQTVDNLLRIALIKARAEDCGITQVIQSGNEIQIYPEEDADFDIWSEISEMKGINLRVKVGEKTYICLLLNRKDAGLATVNKIFEKYIEILRRNRTDKNV